MYKYIAYIFALGQRAQDLLIKLIVISHGSWCPWLRLLVLRYIVGLGSWCPRLTLFVFIIVGLDHGVLAIHIVFIQLGSWCPRYLYQAIYYYGLDHGVLVIYILFSQLGSWCPRYLGYLLLWLGSWCPRHIPFIYIAWIMVSSLSILLYYQSVWIMESSPYYNYIVYYLRLQSRPLSLDYYYVFVIRYCVGCCVNVCLCFRADHFRSIPIIPDYRRLFPIIVDY